LESIAGLYNFEYLKFICTLQITESKIIQVRREIWNLHGPAPAGSTFQLDSTLNSDLTSQGHNIHVLNTSNDGDVTGCLDPGPSN